MAASTGHNHKHTHFHIVIIVLVLIAAFVFLKHFIRQQKWNTYVVESQKTVQNYKSADSAEDGKIIALTIATTPSGSPLIKQPAALQSYIQELGESTERTIVVLDTNKKVLATTTLGRVGQQYAADKGGEVAMTIGDGMPRSFVEINVDNPDGISQTVVPIKDANGATIGALILSSSKIFGR